MNSLAVLSFFMKFFYYYFTCSVYAQKRSGYTTQCRMHPCRTVWCVIRSNVRLPIVSHRASVLVQRYVSATICRLCMTVIIWCL